ncbi:ADP-ribosylglycohydrolase family protein [Streptomyces avidinii]|uniref:ADP-ribosylglycohydrolase family protein n=1 Tax=Streptomyces avidinii TaxID=1895 RepID=UPI0038674B52|nr:ADP-ribosylglycohydrolase family protein [Streptomyces avidinii]
MADPAFEPLRLTWAQPEDLVGHELRQAAEDGRDPAAALRAWLAAGGHRAPDRAGASPTPAPPELRALATRLLDALAQLPPPSAADEPQSWPAIDAACRTGPPGAHPSDTDGRTGGLGREPQPAGRATAAPGDRAVPAHTAQSPPTGRNPRPPAGPPNRAAHPAEGREEPPAPAPGPRRAASTRTGGDTRHPVAQPPPRPDGRTHEPQPGTGHSAPPTRPAMQPDPAVHPAAGGRERGSEPGPPPAGREALPRTGVEAARLRARLEAAWVGRAVGCLLGKPVEKLPLAGIRALARAAGNWPLNDWFSERGVPPEVLAAYPWNRRSAPTSLAENIDGMPEDDDLNYPLLGLLLLQRHGKAFTTADVARLWLDELPAGRTFTAERIAYRNLLLGLEPPATATHHNPFREWIGALIRADVHGWTNPGDPAAAAAQAYRDAALTHTGNGVYAALFVAAATATAATGRADVHTALRAGLAAVPPRSRLAEAVRCGIRTAGQEADFDLVVDRLHARYGHYHWVHAVPNTALIAAALTHADGDFTRSVCRAVSGGWDTDSNGATAGALAGLLAGSADALPHRWTAPLGNRLATTVPGFDGIGFDTLAHLTAQEAARS